MEYSQVVRHRFLVPACKGSNPFTPDYEHPIGSVKNELTTTGEAADCSPWAQLVASQKFYFAKRRERRERKTAESNPFQPANPRSWTQHWLRPGSSLSPCLTPCSVNRALVDLIGPRTRESPAREECMVPWRFMGRAFAVPLPLI